MLKKIIVAAAVLMCAARAQAQAPPLAAPPQVGSDEGTPIDSDLVRERCGACHRSDEQKRMSRISYRRATPENWERTIKRMVSLNHAPLTPADARAILKYLSDHLGLAPEEQRPVAFDAERREIDETLPADKIVADTCSSCHSIARVMSERRTKEEWGLLIAMHRGYYPLVDTQPMNLGQGFRRTRPLQTEAGPDGRPPDNRHPMDKALEYWEKTLPFKTSEWAAWSAAMQSPRLDGRWAVTGTAPGKGTIYGHMTIAADPSAPDTFSTNITYAVARTGEAATRTGRAVVYTGYQWRGRHSTAGSDPQWREAMVVERGWNEMWGRWFTGEYDETGIDVRLVRLTGAPAVLGTSISAVQTGAANQTLRIFGANLPASPRPEDIGLGQGVRVSRIVSATPDEITVGLDVAATAPIGARNLSVAGTVKPSALVVFDRVDTITVLPRAGMARVGGAAFPKQLQQFEAVGAHNGPDGKPGTADDLTLGLVDVKWSIEEYTATFADDDTQFVGALDANGLFTPAIDGPNPKRSGNRNNIGDVWVVAELASGSARDPTKPLRARSQLLVTVPLYMSWFESEAGK